MNAKEFVSTIYLGDRACKRILVDGLKGRLGIQIDCISRLKTGTDTWNYYTDEDVYDGWIVFSGLRSFSAIPSGPIPNDSVEIVNIREAESIYVFDISVGSVDENGRVTEVRIDLAAKEVSIETNNDFLCSLK